MRTSSIIGRVAILGAGAVLVWRCVLALPGDTAGPDTARHLLQGTLISAGVVVLLALLLRLDRRGLPDVGMGPFPANARAFLLGVGLWALPALAGAAACVGLGWASISLESSVTAVLAALPPLALGVFLFEAFPEELILRGYVQGLVGRRYAAWVALLAQMLVFVLFAWAVGALYSTEQWMLIPGLALILGYARAVSGNVWCCIGIHLAWMTTAQLLSPAHGHAVVQGMQTLQFIAFALLPSMTIGIVLPLLRPTFDWRRTMA